MNIGKAIKEIRKRKGISQKDLAGRIGISVNALCSIENRKTFPWMKHIDMICEALGVAQSVLMFFSISEEDIPEHKRELFHTLAEPLKDNIL